MKNILITSYYCYPENSPRAFRTFELARGFSQLGHKVALYIPDIGFDYSDISKENNLKIVTVPSGFLLNRKSSYNSPLPVGPVITNKKTLVRLLKRIVSNIIPEAEKIEYAITLHNRLAKDNNKYDLIISIALPFCVHLGTYRFINRQSLSSTVTVADYGDPFFFNKETPKNPLFYLIEHHVLNAFDYISVPTLNSMILFRKFKLDSSIKVIPQGMDFSNIVISNYQKNKILTFAYAGIFYSKLRNPSVFMDFLCNCDFDFRFIVYTAFNNTETRNILAPYLSKLSGKLILKEMLPRKECINELSKLDFLINVVNISDSQTPSKLIDYALTKRPVYSFRQDNFNSIEFMEFIRDFENKNFNFDITAFDINKVVMQFIELVND